MVSEMIFHLTKYFKMSTQIGLCVLYEIYTKMIEMIEILVGFCRRDIGEKEETDGKQTNPPQVKKTSEFMKPKL